MNQRLDFPAFSPLKDFKRVAGSPSKFKSDFSISPLKGRTSEGSALLASTPPARSIETVPAANLGINALAASPAKKASAGDSSVSEEHRTRVETTNHHSHDRKTRPTESATNDPTNVDGMEEVELEPGGGDEQDGGGDEVTKPGGGQMKRKAEEILSSEEESRKKIDLRDSKVRAFFFRRNILPNIFIRNSSYRMATYTISRFKPLETKRTARQFLLYQCFGSA